MPTIDTLIHARWVIPVEPDNTVLDAYSVALDQGRIIDILPTVEARTRYQAKHVVEKPTHALIPGLVNAHTHASMTLLRGIADDLPLMEWLQNHIWPAESRWVGPEFVYDGTQLALAESLRGGVTCINEMYFFPDQAVEAAIAAGARICAGLIVIDFPTAWAANTDQYIEKAIALHDRYRGHPLVTTAFAPHAPYTVSDAPLQRIRTLSDELDIPIHIHVHETAGEIDQSNHVHGKRPLARLEDLGLLSPKLLAVHMTQLTSHEIDRCAELGVHVLHCPESNMKLASGFCQVDALLKAGVNVALGTDGAASNNDLDMFGEMRSAALLGKVVANNASAIPAHTALRMATLNGAKALGLDADIGSLVVGKAADVVAMDLSSIDLQPVYHPISHIVYAAGRQHVTDVWVAGRRVVQDSLLTTLSEAAVRAKAAEWHSKISAKATA